MIGLKDVNQFAALAEAELDLALRGSEEGVVSALLHVEARMDLAASLANDDGTGRYLTTVEHLYA